MYYWDWLPLLPSYWSWLDRYFGLPFRVVAGVIQMTPLRLVWSPTPGCRDWKAKVRGPRLALGCVLAVLLAVILGVATLLIVGFQVLDFLRDLGRGHPG